MLPVEGEERVLPETAVSTAVSDLLRWPDSDPAELSGADVDVVTSGGRRIPTHSSVLAAASPVLENILTADWSHKRRSSGKVAIPISGVPCNAVLAFLRYLYSSRCTEEEMGRYGMHLLALSHVYRVGGLKRACVAALAGRITAEDVVDVLQLARLCDAPRLYLRCMRLLAADFASVEKTEGWRFLQAHDPWLELEILQSLQEADKWKKRRERNRKAQDVYAELSEAMECLRHICTEGCTEVGPRDDGGRITREPCGKFRTCQGLQRLIRHFATCERKKTAAIGGAGGGCGHCKRMWQLLRLHASTCEQPEPCRVPLCKQFKLRMQLEKKGGDERWMLLVRKVVSAKVISSLSKRKREEEVEPQKPWGVRER